MMTKYFRLTFLALITILCFSCADAIDDCINDMTGNFNGTACTMEVINIELGKSTGDNNEITINLFNADGGNLYGVFGKVDENCGITIESQTLNFTDLTISDDPFDVTFTGTGTFNQNDLVLTINQDSDFELLNGPCEFVASK